MADLEALLSERARSAMARALGSAANGVDPAVRRSDRADYQINAALGLAKVLRRPPREVAESIAAQFEPDEICERIEVSGPGFINLTVRDEYLAQLLSAELLRVEAPMVAPSHQETVVIDYSAPNLSKEMHVGHLRSTILGDALARVLSWQGHRVIAQNHIGDWGTPFGMLIEHLIDLGEQAAAQELSLRELGQFYQQARVKFDSEPTFSERSRQRVVLLQNGDPKTTELWQLLVEKSKAYFSEIYRRLGVRLEEADIRGESFYIPMLPAMAADLEAQGVARIDAGALCIFLEGFIGRDGEPLPLMVRKKDGGFGYAATDLAAIRYRTEVLRADRLLYVMGATQQQHLSMVFAAARKIGWLGESVRAEHVPFGSVLGLDKKMLKTRSGESVKLIDLLDEAEERAERVVTQKNPNLDGEGRARIARLVGIGAVKYADLSSDRIKDYVFDWDRMLALEGNTSPYLQYAHARICSIFRKANLDPPKSDPDDTRAPVLLSKPEERALALELVSFEPAVRLVCESLQPHRLAGYLYTLAGRFSAFYETCAVLKAETEELYRSRLALSGATALRLRKGLELLGIQAPERM
ncbi:MAG TPA: arginine--tRNA ligase [Polyangiaceae bacterium]|jgi:arginyl-tRNA synthetase